jgi:hypothetical protein
LNRAPSCPALPGQSCRLNLADRLVPRPARFRAADARAALNGGESRTAWFVESLRAEVAILPAVRTQRPLLRGRRGGGVLRASLAVAAAAVALPCVPGLAAAFGLLPLPPQLTALPLAITAGQVLANGGTRRRLRRRFAL